ERDDEARLARLGPERLPRLEAPERLVAQLDLPVAAAPVVEPQMLEAHDLRTLQDLGRARLAGRVAEDGVPGATVVGRRAGWAEVPGPGAGRDHGRERGKRSEGEQPHAAPLYLGAPR